MTFARVSQKSYWPTLKPGIAKYFRVCKTCQQLKSENSQPGGKAVEPWDMICVDLVGHLVKSSQGQQYILTAVMER